MKRSSKPASVFIEGSKLDNEKYITGVYEPTDEVCCGLPVYKKIGDDVWLEASKPYLNSWRWYVKPGAERGETSTVCYGYGVSHDVVLPHDCDEGKWEVNDDLGFVQEPELTCVLAHPDEIIPEIFQDLVMCRRMEYENEKEEFQKLVCSLF